MSVIVVGAGVAGIAAAARLAEAGVPVTLIETRKKLGGRATSFADARTGKVLDNCQHVVLGCCTAYMDLLERLDGADNIVWHEDQYWIEEPRGGGVPVAAGGRLSRLSPAVFPAPLHFGLSVLLRAPFMSLADITALARASLAIMRVDRSKHADESFHSYLRTLAQSERLIRRFWNPVVVSACNMTPETVSASSALHVFQEGFYACTRAAAIGVPSVPLVDLYQGLVPIIERAGGVVMLGTSAETITADSVTLADGRVLQADHVISALPFERVARAIPDDIRAADDRFANLHRLTHSPILGVHLFFDAPVLPYPHAVLVEKDTQWLFRKNDDGSTIHAVISAADDWIPLTEEQIVERVLADVHACLPESRGTNLIDARAVKEKRATFAPVPGSDAWRPHAQGSSGIILAGDYTATGWPATMEGATRSGYVAAACVLDKPVDALVPPPLRIATLSRLLGVRRTPAPLRAAMPTPAVRRPVLEGSPST